MPGSSSWMSYAPQGEKGFDEDDDVEPPGSDVSYHDSNTMTPDFLVTGSSRQIRMFKYVNQPSRYVALLPIHYTLVPLASCNICNLAGCSKARNKLTIITTRILKIEPCIKDN